MNEIEQQNDNKKIIVLNPVKYQWGGLFSTEQMMAFAGGAGATLEINKYASQLDFPYNVAVYAINIPIWGGLWWGSWKNKKLFPIKWGGIVYHTRSHEKLIESIHIAEFRLKQLLGLNKFMKYSDSDKKIDRFFKIDEVSPEGRVCFSKTKGQYGVLIACISGTATDYELEQRTTVIQRLHDSIPAEDYTVHISLKSQIMMMNTVEKMIIEQCPTGKTKEEMELISSMLKKSQESKKPIEWFMTVGVFIESKNDEIIQSFSNSTIPGIMRVIQNAGIIAYPITYEPDILELYANDFSCIRSHKADTIPLLLDNNSLYSKPTNQILPSKIQFFDRHYEINEREYGTCLVCLIPNKGASGVPTDISYRFIEQLYSISTSERCMIKIDLKYMPAERGDAIKQITKHTSTINTNIGIAEKNKQLAQVKKLKHERRKWEIMNNRVSDRDLGMYYGVLIITVQAQSKNEMDNVRGQVERVLDARRINNEIISGKIPTVYLWSKLIPFRETGFLKRLTPRMFTDVLTQVTPGLIGAHPLCDDTGDCYGVTEEGKEIVYNGKKLNTEHMLIMGASGTGKTIFELSYGVRKLANGDIVTYITDKWDGKIYIEKIAAWLTPKLAQIIELGPKPTKNEELNTVNILDIVHPDIDFDAVEIYNRQISIVKNWFRIIFPTLESSDNVPAYLGESVRHVYEKFGINKLDPKTWHPAIPPTLSDLVKIWEEDLAKLYASRSNSEEDADRKRAIRALLNKKELFEDSGNFLCRPTNVTFDKRWTVISLANIARVDINISNAMKYYLTFLLSDKMLSYNIKVHKVLTVDEGRALFQNEFLRTYLATLLTQARSFNGEVDISVLEPADIEAVKQVILANVSKVMVFGNNIHRVLGDVINILKLSTTSEEYLARCTEPGQGVFAVGRQEYRIKYELNDKEKEVILGELPADKQAMLSGYRFLNPALEEFSKEQRIILSDTIEGDVSYLKENWKVVQRPRAFGTGTVTAYIDPDPEFLREDGKIWNQTLPHILDVMQIAIWGINKNIKTIVNHNNGADVVFTLQNNKTLAIENQTTAKHIHEKILQAGSRYDSLLLVGDSIIVREMKAALNDTDEQRKVAQQIIVSKGKQLEQRLQELVNEAEQKTPIPAA